jgi:transcriptional regulator with XRE-family HTH domain
MTQRGLASKLRLTEGAVSRWVTMRTEPDLENLARAARILRVTTDWLLGLSGETPHAVADPAVDPRLIERALKQAEAARGASDAAIERLREALDARKAR